MNGIKVNGEFLDLFPDTRVSFVLENPIFADDNIIPGDYSLPLTIPFGLSSPRNTRILKSVQAIENVVRLQEVDADFYFDQMKYKTGKLVIGEKDQVGQKLSVNFKFGFSALTNIKRARIKDIVSEVITLNDNPAYTKQVRLDPLLSAPYSITINGRTYKENTIDDLVYSINTDDAEPGATAISHTTYFTVQPSNNPTDITTPFTVDGDGREWTVTPNDEDWNAPVRAALEAYLAEPYPNDKFRMPWIINRGQYEAGYQFNQTGGVNMSMDGAFVPNYSAPEGDSIIHFNPFVSWVSTSYAPYVMLKHVLDKIATFYGFAYEGDFYTRPWVAKALIYTPNSITQKIPFIGKYPFFFIQQSFNIADFVPELTVSELFKALQTRFNLAVYYKPGQKTLVMRFRKTIVKSIGYRDVSRNAYMTKHQESYVKGVKFNIDPDKNDKICPDDQLSIGTQQDLTVTTPCFGLSEKIDNVSGDTLPAVDQLFSTAIYKYLRLFFYEGIQASAGYSSFDFPFSRINQDTFDMNFAGGPGMYNTQWKEYVSYLMNRRTAQLTSNFSFAKMLSLDWEQKAMYDGSKYLYDKIEVSLGMNPSEPVKADISIHKVKVDV